MCRGVWWKFTQWGIGDNFGVDMHAVSHAISFTTDVSGDATEYTETDVNGRIFQIQYVKDDLTNGSTITLTGAKTGVPIFSITSMNASATHQVLRTATASEEIASGTGAASEGVSSKVLITDSDLSDAATVGMFVKCDFADDEHADGRYEITQIVSHLGRAYIDLAYVADENVDWILDRTFPVHQPVTLAGERIKCVVSDGGSETSGALAIITG